jgi:hypothetical protein
MEAENTMITLEELDKALRRHAVEIAQIRELADLRSKLLRLFLMIQSVRDIMEAIKNRFYKNEDDVRAKSPHRWQEIQDYKLFSLDLYYKCKAKNYGLFPKWMKREPIAAFLAAMEPFLAPSAPLEKPMEEVKAYMVKIHDMIEFIDETIQQPFAPNSSKHSKR